MALLPGRFARAEICLASPFHPAEAPVIVRAKPEVRKGGNS